jgi:hypothetical protein
VKTIKRRDEMRECVCCVGFGLGWVGLGWVMYWDRTYVLVKRFVRRLFFGKRKISITLFSTIARRIELWHSEKRRNSTSKRSSCVNKEWEREGKPTLMRRETKLMSITLIITYTIVYVCCVCACVRVYSKEREVLPQKVRVDNQMGILFSGVLHYEKFLPEKRVRQ